MASSPGRLILIAGPSGIGKSPLLDALQQDRPDLADRLEPIVLYNDRSPRPGESDGVDYHFRDRDEIEQLRDNDYFVVMEVRGDLQALEVPAVKKRLQEGDAVFEGNPYVAAAMLDEPRLAEVERVSVFISPVSLGELRALREDDRADAEQTVTDVMRRKLLRRTRKQKGELSLPDLENVEKRAGRAYHELSFAPRFDHVLPNHDGEDGENWDAFALPLGDAGRTVAGLAALLDGGAPNHAEDWSDVAFE